MEAEVSDYRKLEEIGIPLPEMIEADRACERIVKEYIAGGTV